MKPLDALFATLLALAIVAVVVGSSSSATALNNAFSALSGLVGKIMNPIQGA